MKSIVILLMLVSIAAAHDTPQLVLDKMFVKLGTFEYYQGEIALRKTYYVSRNIKLTWAHSVSFCRSFGMELVSLPTEEEADVFTELCAKKASHFEEYAHIGGSYIGNGLNNWYWINDGKPLNYRLKMSPGEPNNFEGKEDCLSVHKQPGSFKFNDIHGYGTHEEKFVCQFDSLSGY